MPRGVKYDPNAPIEINGQWYTATPCEEAEACYVEPSDEFLPVAAQTGPSHVATGPTTGVYFLRAPSVGLVKIGLGRCVVLRVNELRKASPVSVAPAGFIPTPHDYKDAFALERQLHERFAADRHHGEWFTETPTLTAFMEAHLAAWPIPHAH